MDNTALFKLSYGVFVLTAKSGEKENGCITNTCIMTTVTPTQVALCVQKSNYTCDLMLESGVFAVSILDETTTFDTISYWGFRSGRDVDKISVLDLPRDENGVPYVTRQVTSVLSCKTTAVHDLDTHYLFVAEVLDAKLISGKAPLTYADYQDKVKPKPAAVKQEKKIIGWRCKICQYEYEGAELPEDFLCPLCGHDKDDFEPIYEE